jgi:hypothetical protein
MKPRKFTDVELSRILSEHASGSGALYGCYRCVADAEHDHGWHAIWLWYSDRWSAERLLRELEAAGYA